jgi:hypothetical protein
MLRRVSNPDGAGLRKTTSAKKKGAAGAKMVGRSAAKNQAAIALGKLGARKGGLARAAKLTANERSAIARKAAKARWKKSSGRKKIATRG